MKAYEYKDIKDGWPDVEAVFGRKKQLVSV